MDTIADMQRALIQEEHDHAQGLIYVRGLLSDTQNAITANLNAWERLPLDERANEAAAIVSSAATRLRMSAERLSRRAERVQSLREALRRKLEAETDATQA